MEAVLPVLAKKFADTWLTLLVLPGLLYTAVLVVAHAAGHHGALDGAQTLSGLESLARAAQRSGSAGTVLLLVAAVAVSSAAGYAATALGSAIQWIWLGTWGGGGWLVRRRSRRWDAAHDRYAAELLRLDGQTPRIDAVAVRRLAELATIRNRISLARPARPTWIGDRFAAAEMRVWSEYRIDLGFCWPRLWLVLPEEARTECSAARAAFDSASSLAGWGALYFLAGCWWWPGAVLGLGMVLVAWRKGRDTATGFADLIESVIDVYGPELGLRLGVTAEHRPLDTDVGASISAQIRKGA
ncbi:hypothetical protein [Streptomyces synnematoformans]|uniref:Vegetative cell wall protein gp1 n=1 Tax=Streptomyces synnematoformans TaxID=415721 RepID=A0ABN2ZFL3_9ACTN